MAPDAHVVEARHEVEESDVLECSRDAQPRHLVRLRAGDVATVENYTTCCRLEESRNVVEQRGLAGPVGADQGEDLAALDVQAHVVDRDQPAKALGEVRELEDVLGGAQTRTPSSTADPSSCTAACLSSCSRTRLGNRPCGRRSMIRTRISPKIRNCIRCTSAYRPGQSPFCALSEPTPTVLARDSALAAGEGSNGVRTKYMTRAPMMTAVMVPIPPS